MWSPPSSEGDLSDILDFNSILPESLNNGGNNSPLDILDLFEEKVEMLQPQSEQPIKTPTVSVNVTKAITNSDVFVGMHHNYAATVKVQPEPDISSVEKVPKYVELEPECGFAVCGPMSKNAVLARENRRKKKEYTSNLEKEIDTLKHEKQSLSAGLSRANSTITELHEEIAYLKSVIANDTALATLLKNISPSSLKRTQSVSDSSNSVIPRKVLKRTDHYNRANVTPIQPGVCLHVTQDSISMEFCNKCNDDSRA